MTGETSNRGTRTSSGDTSSATYRQESSQREMMEQPLMDLGVWLGQNPKAPFKNLKPIRSAKLLDPGVYYNQGTGMVERVYRPQHVALGHRLFRITTDPAAPVEEIRRRAMEGR